MELSAPGKVFLTGEYAVLWGAPAIVAGVAPRLKATLTVDGDTARLRAPGADVNGSIASGKLSWSREEPGARFAQRALELSMVSRGFDLRFSPGPRANRGRKLGLGTSAAAATIAAAAGLQLREDAPPLRPDEVFRIAAQAHWEVQGKRGSNGDVAASCWGGLIRYTRWPVELEASARPPPEVATLGKPELALGLVFSGRSAKTPSMVAAVEAALTPADRARFVAQSTERTEAFASALAKDDRRAALEALNASGDLLDELGKRAGVAVVTPHLARILAHAREHGLAAKVTGAGGGDSAIVASFDARALRECLRDLARNGYEGMTLELSEGVRLDRRG